MTETTQLGQPVALLLQWYDTLGGVFADVTNLTITITPVIGGAAVVGPTSSIDHPATGNYVYVWTPDMTTPVGDYLAVWECDQGDSSEIVTVTSAAAGSDDQTADVWYCTREDVKQALDVKETARNNAQIDRAIAAATGEIEGLLRRRFYPMTATRSFPWPSRSPGVAPWRLWLDADEVISVLELTAGGVELEPGDYFLEPVNSGPPYSSVQINLESSAAFGSSGTWQRAISMTGVFGHSARELTAGALAETLDDSETLVDVTDSAAVGVGQILRVGSERMIVTGKSMLDTGQNLGGNLTASAADVTVAVASGTAFSVGEIILIQSERMLIVDIAGNNLTVKRAWDGTVLAAHTAPQDVYALRTLTVQRGALGTTAATHATAATIYRHVVPAQVRTLAVAEALVTVAQELSGYARTSGSGENQRETYGRALERARKEARAALGRKARLRSV